MAKRMTSAERKAAEAEAYDRALFAALAWPKEPCPQPYSIDRMRDLSNELGYRRNDVVTAWTYNTARRQPMHGCFGKSSHSAWSTTETTSQTQGGPWFATEAEARLAMRWKICGDMAADLLALIKQEARHD